MLEFFNGDWIDASERFVEQDEVRFGGHCTRDFDSASFSARKHATHAVADFFDVQFIAQAVDTFFLDFLAESAGFKNEANVVFDRESTEDAGFLGKVAETCAGAFVHWPAGDDCFIKLNIALVRSNKASNHVESSCFSCTIWAEKAYDLASSELDADIVYDTPFFVDFYKIIGGNFHLILAPVGLDTDFGRIAARAIFEGLHVVVDKNVDGLAFTVRLVIKASARDFHVADQENFPFCIHG